MIQIREFYMHKGITSIYISIACYTGINGYMAV